VIVVATVTVAEALLAPPAPVQVIVYTFALPLTGVTGVDPLNACDPDHEPDAVQAVVFVLDQESVADWPEATAVGLAEIVTVGTEAAEEETVKVIFLIASELGPKF
jgi:hypothetical protein